MSIEASSTCMCCRVALPKCSSGTASSGESTRFHCSHKARAGGLPPRQACSAASSIDGKVSSAVRIASAPPSSHSGRAPGLLLAAAVAAAADGCDGS